MKKSVVIFFIIFVCGAVIGLVSLFSTTDLDTAISEYDDKDYVDAIVILNNLLAKADYETKEKIYYYRTKSINKLALSLEKDFNDELKSITLENQGTDEFIEAKKEVEEEIKHINKKINGDLSLNITRKISRIISNGQFYQEFLSQFRGSSLVEDLDFEELTKLSHGAPQILSKSLVAFYKKHPNTNYLSQLVRMIFQLLQDGNIKLSASDTTIMSIILNYGKQYPTSPEFNKIHQCTGDNVNLRNSPGLEGKTVGKIKRDEMVIQLEKSIDVQQVGDHRDYWYRITTLNGLRGWIFGKFLKDLDIAKLQSVEQIEESWAIEDNFDKWVDSHTPQNWGHVPGAQKKAVVFTQTGDNKILLVESNHNTSGLFNRINTRLAFNVTTRARFISGDSLTLFAYVLGNKKSYILNIQSEAVVISGRTIPLPTSDWHEYTLYSEDGKYAVLKIDGEIISSRIVPINDDNFTLQGVYCGHSTVTRDAKAEIDYIKVR